MKLRNLTLAMFTFTAWASQATDLACTPGVLNNIANRTEIMSASGLHPVVVFDLDDTLINTRARTQRILRELGADPKFANSFPAAAKSLLALKLDETKYLLKDTFLGLGLSDGEALNAATVFWSERFFSDSYVASDTPTAGAAAYVRLLVKAGAEIVYLTGRDVPRMARGTEENLTRNGFPMGSGTWLMLKPDALQSDIEFKKAAFESIRTLGNVVGVYENEPANLNALADAFPSSTPIFLNTIHSPTIEAPRGMSTYDFTANGGCL